MAAALGSNDAFRFVSSLLITYIAIICARFCSVFALAPLLLLFLCPSGSVSPLTCEANQYFSVQIVFRCQRFDNFCWSAAQFRIISLLSVSVSLPRSLCLFRSTLTCFVCHCVACCNMPVTVQQQHQFAWQLIA